MAVISSSTKLAFWARGRAWWRSVFASARNRILMLYLLLLLLLSAVATPIFMWLFLAQVNQRVRADLIDEMADFQAAYADWESDQVRSVAELRQFVDEFLAKTVPQDDNFLIFTIDGTYYRSNPQVLPAIMQPSSKLMGYWALQTQPLSGERTLSDPNIGDILYLVQPLELEGDVRAVFISAHATRGEREEALAGVYLFFWVAAGVVIVAFAIAWIITGQLLAPVQKLATTARLVSESDLTQRIAVKGSGEIADIANTFNDMLDRLQSAFVSQRNFINDAGHELRTPITIIRGHIELLGTVSREQQETLDLVVDELDRMSRFVNDLLLLTRAEQPDFLQLEHVALPAFIEELFQKVSALADRNWRLHRPQSGDLVADRQRLTGAVISLVQNAVQHTRMGDLIELGAALSPALNPTTVRLWVRDTGTGIPLSEQERIFERFARLPNRYRRSDGAGLGLSIVKAITEAHGGYITLSSTVGVGSTFTLVLPLHPSLRLPSSVQEASAPREAQ